MSFGDAITIQKLDESEDWQDFMRIHALQVNKTRSREFMAGDAEQSASYVTFRVRWNKRLSAIEDNMSSYRLVWRGRTFDIRGYDDYMYQHRRVDLVGVSYGL